MKTLRTVVIFLIVLGFTMWAFVELIPEKTKPESNTVEVLSDYEVYGLKY